MPSKKATAQQPGDENEVPLRFLSEFQDFCRASWDDKEELVRSTQRQMFGLLPVVSALLGKQHLAPDEEEAQDQFMRLAVENLEAVRWLSQNREAHEEILEVEPAQVDARHPVVAPVWNGFAAVMRPQWESDWQRLARACGWEDWEAT